MKRLAKLRLPRTTRTEKRLVKPSGVSRIPYMPDPMIHFQDVPESLTGRTTLNQLNTFMEALDHESDRGLVLTIAAICDDLCEQWLKEIFRKGNREVRKDLFGFPGPFSSFSGRVKALYAHGSIDAELFRDLETIRSLRNDCAHEWATFRFTRELTKKFVDPLFRNYVQLWSTADGSSAIRTPQHKMHWVAFRLISALSQR